MLFLEEIDLVLHNKESNKEWVFSVRGTVYQVLQSIHETYKTGDDDEKLNRYTWFLGLYRSQPGTYEVSLATRRR